MASAYNPGYAAHNPQSTVECVVCKDQCPATDIHWCWVTITSNPSYQQQTGLPFCSDCWLSPNDLVYIAQEHVAQLEASAAKYLAQRPCEELSEELS